MRLSFYISIIALCFISNGFIPDKNLHTLPASSLLPFGRYAWTDKKELELISSAVHFGFRFQGKECRIQAHLADTTAHSYLQYELDGVYQKRIKVMGNSRQPLVITAPPGGTHTIWIYKATEAHTGPVFISSITGSAVEPIARPSAPLIEFIGNSITCGAAADASEIPCGKGAYHDQHNAYYAYGPRVARALSANYVLSSVSGIGIYRNWNSDGPTMPQVYEKTDFQDYSTRQWHFETYSPKVVSIALGTNDFSMGDGKRARLPFDSTVFTSTYIKFVQLVKSKYPTAQIALLSSAMVRNKNGQTLANCLAAVKANIDQLYPSHKPVAVYIFKPMIAKGCTGHPNVEDHAVLAEEVTPFFRKLLE